MPGRYLFFARNGGISVVFGDDGGFMAAETAIAGTTAQSGDLRQTVRTNHDARSDAVTGASSMVMSANGVSTPGVSTWVKIGGGVTNGDFGGELDVSHFVGQAGIEAGLNSGFAAGVSVGGLLSTAETATDELEGDALFAQPYLAYVNGGLTAVASFTYTYTDYDDTLDNIDSGDRFTGALALAYDVFTSDDVTVAPFGYLAAGFENFDVASGDDDQDFLIGRLGLELSRDVVLPSTGSLNVFAAFGPEYISADTVTSAAGPLTLTDYDDDRFGAHAQLGFEFTVAGTDARLFASATGSGLFTDAPGISGQVGLSVPF